MRAACTVPSLRAKPTSSMTALSGSTCSDYRADIDGLRAFAVLSVVAFHAFGAAGGFAGVDVFFVISGFLITGILQRDLAEERFSIARFYERRARRIFPALIVVLLATLGGAWCLLWSDELQQVGKHVAAGAGFVANLMYWGEAGYFDRASEAKPLLHLWSLGIEEQFYIVWPLLLWGLHRLRASAWWIGALLAVSFGWNVHQVSADPVAAFYSPLGRAWELLAGALLACQVDRLRALPPVWRSALAWLGLVSLLACTAVLDRHRAFPGAWALLPVVGACCVLAAGPRAFVNLRFWSLPGLVWVGRLSYSLYLWHWPLLALAFAVEGDTPTATYRVGAVVASVGLAWASLRWIETPTRTGCVGPRWAWVMAIALAAVGSVGYGLFRSDGFPERAAQHDPRRAFLKHYRDLHESGLTTAYRAECDFYDWQRKAGKAALPAACTEPGERATYFLWGDSHAQALSLGLRQNLPAGVRLAQVATSACKPALQTPPTVGLAGSCTISNAYALSQIRRLRPAVVVLAQSDRHDLTDWTALGDALKRVGVRRVVLVGPVPQWKPSLPLVVTRHHWGAQAERFNTGLDRGILALDQRLRARFGASQDPVYVSLIEALCNEAGCQAYVPQAASATLMAVDYGHLSPEASAYVVQRALRPVLALP